MAGTHGVGILGCGNISTAYLRLIPLFAGIEVRAVADILPEAAKARSDEYGVPAMGVEEMLKSDEIDVIVNLTVPAAHYEVLKAIVSAGKHAYSEKPFVLSVEEGLELKGAAEATGVSVGSAPDTFLGGAHQHARRLIDQGKLGRITSGTCHVMSHGMEAWHPNPDFFFKPGAGPVLDIGPYYVTNLIQLLGPVKRVMAMTGMAETERTIRSEPRAGETIKVETPTTIHALLEFGNGAIVTLGTSWDVWAHGHHNMELYGTDGTIFVPDPNFFGGDVTITGHGPEREDVGTWGHPFEQPNWERPKGPAISNYRGAGLADMMAAVEAGRPARCSLDLALHAVDVMTSILKSGEFGQAVELETTCERPQALAPDQAQALLKG